MGDDFWASIEAEAPEWAEIFPKDYEDIPDPLQEGDIMANHLKGRQCLFELDERGNLVIHTDGRHMTIPADDVASLLKWLNRKREEAAAKEQALRTHGPR